MLQPTGGGGSRDYLDVEAWVWPLPPEGPLGFVCEWPLAEIPLSRAVVDASVLRTAAVRATTLWLPEGNGSTGNRLWTTRLD